MCIRDRPGTDDLAGTATSGTARGRIPGGPRSTLSVLVGAVLVLLVIVPAVLFVRDGLRDPVRTGLDGLSLPTWAVLDHQDQDGGNRYCVQACSWHKRIYQSGRPAVSTNAAFQDALRRQGWVPLVTAGCPRPPTGTYTCWQRDQYVLDLWTRDAGCTSSEAHPLPGPSETPGPPEDGLAPSAPPVRASGPPSADCPAAQVTVLVLNRADPAWHG